MVRYAEEAYCISEDESDTSYLKPDAILAIAKKTGAAIHPGYGFLSENADFARRCEEEGSHLYRSECRCDSQNGNQDGSP